MDQSDKTVPDTEYRQSFTSQRTESWNKVVSLNESYQDGPLTQTTYRSSFSWPKKSREVVPDIEPIIVAEKVVPGTAVPIHETGTKKSHTIPNLSEVAGKPDVEFAKETEPVPVVEKINKKSEYKSKFRPFSAYVYVTGNGFIKPKNVDQLDKGKTQSWYSEVEERNREANHYKTRSQLGHPLASEGLEQIYSQGALWNNYHRDRNLQALALATTQKIIEEKKAERAYYNTPLKSSHPIRQLSSAPPSLRTEIQSAGSPASVRTKSPHALSRVQDTTRPRSADKHSKTSAMSESPKPEGKIWLKPKPKATEEKKEEKKEKPSKLPTNSGHTTKSSDKGNSGPKSPRPTTLTNSGNGKNEKPKEKPPIPSGPIRTTQIKSPEEITGVKSPSPESWTVPIDRQLNWINGETPRTETKYSADMSAIKSVPVSDKSKTNDKNVVSEDLIKKSEPKPTSVSTHTKPTATVQPSPSASLSSISNPSSKRVQSIEEEVKIVKPDARKKAGTVLNRAKHRLDQLWSRNK